MVGRRIRDSHSGPSLSRCPPFVFYGCTAISTQAHLLETEDSGGHRRRASLTRKGPLIPGARGGKTFPSTPPNVDQKMPTARVQRYSRTGTDASDHTEPGIDVVADEVEADSSSSTDGEKGTDIDLDNDAESYENKVGIARDWCTLCDDGAYSDLAEFRKATNETLKRCTRANSMVAVRPRRPLCLRAAGRKHAMIRAHNNSPNPHLPFPIASPPRLPIHVIPYPLSSSLFLPPHRVHTSLACSQRNTGRCLALAVRIPAPQPLPPNRGPRPLRRAPLTADREIVAATISAGVQHRNPFLAPPWPLSTGSSTPRKCTAFSR